jgi:hypothetical protein
MKRGTPDHPKTLRLMEELQCSKVVAVGVLELLWHFTSTYAPRGDVGRFSPAQIAKAIGWEGDPEALIAALISCRWLDRRRRCGLLVHDWPEHADDAVHMSLARRGIRFATGAVPSMRRFSEQERKKLEASFRAHAVRTPCAMPLPEPEPVTTTPLPPSGGETPANPPNPPAGAGGSAATKALDAETRAERARIAGQVELARQFAIHEGHTPWREHLRTFKHWFAAGLSLAEVQHRIELGEHLPRSAL